MALTTQDGLVAAMAGGQTVLFNKASQTSVANFWFSVFAQSGNPGGGTLAGASTAAGVVPTPSSLSGFPVLNAFSGSNTGYLSTVGFGNTVACRLRLVDMLFKAGAYAFNASQTLASQPSYSGRVPGGTDFKSTEIWIEAVTAFTGNPTITVTYTNQDGTTGRSTGAIALGFAPIVGRMTQLPLQAGDTGVSKIESVTCTVATVGTFNVLVLRPLWMGRVRTANDGYVHGPDMTDLPIVFATSALMLMINADSTATGIPDLDVGIING